MVEPTHLKNISQNGFIFPQVGVKITNLSNHHPDEVSPQNKTNRKQLANSKHKHRRNDWTSDELPSWKSRICEGGELPRDMDMRDHDGI